MSAYRVFKIFKDGTKKRISTKRTVKSAANEALLFALISNRLLDRGITCIEVHLDGKVVRRVDAVQYLPPEKVEEEMQKINELPAFLRDWKIDRHKRRFAEMASTEPPE